MKMWFLKTDRKLNTSGKQECRAVLYLTRGRLRTGIPMTIHRVENWEKPRIQEGDKMWVDTGHTMSDEC